MKCVCRFLREKLDKAKVKRFSELPERERNQMTMYSEENKARYQLVYTATIGC